MTQIFTGNGLGLHGSSIGLGSYGPKGVAALGQGGESVYVNAANGNLVLRQSDGFMADVGFGLDLFQTYNSRGESGANWCFNMQSRLEFSGEVNTLGSSVTRIDEDGHRSRLSFDATLRSYLPDEGGTARVTFSSSGWSYQEGSLKTTNHYNMQGQLTEISDRDGHSIYFSYENGQLINITDKSGKQRITWSFKNGLLQDVKIISDGKTIQDLHYEYDEYNRLHKVSRDLGQGKTYWITYDYVGESNWISAINQSDGTSLHIDYDAEGRVKKLIDGEGRISIYEYGLGKTTVTNGAGESWTYFYDDNNRLTGIDGPEQYRVRYYYEGKYLSSIVQGDQVWCFRYNEQGDCVRIEEPNGQVTQRIFDSAHHLLSETHYQTFDGTHHPAKPLTTRYIYDEQGHLLFTIAADGTVTERRYDEQGQLISCRTYLYSSFESGMMNEDELISLEQMLLWTNKQNPQDVSLIDYQYDWRGQLIEEIHYSQVDLFGKGIMSHASSTRCRYDASGRLVEKSTPVDRGWSTTHYIYDDLGRLIQTIDNQNHSQKIEYDDAHHRIIQTESNGLQTISTYDSSGLLISVLRLDNSHSFGSRTYKYDSAGRLIAETGVDGLTTYSFYDKQGRLQARVSPGGHVTEYRYNDEGLVVQTHEYQHQILTTNWLEHFPAYDQIKPESSASDRITQVIYNEYNQVAFRIDSEGYVLSYLYDAEGHTISIKAYAERLKNYNSTELLTLNSIHVTQNTKDRTSLFYYDSSGRLEAEINGEGFAKSYSYDRLGNLIGTCKYFNEVPKSLRGDWLLDKPAPDASKDIHMFMLYDARGLKVAEVDGEGYLIEFRYDERGLLVEQCVYEQAVSKSISIDSKTTLEQIRPQNSHNDHHTYYKYDDLDHLIEQKTQSGLVTTYVYDEMGLLIIKTLLDEKTHAARQQRYRYDALGRVIQSLDEIGSALLNRSLLSHDEIEFLWQKHSMSYEYDNAGLLLSKTNSLNEKTRYFYDEHQKLRYTVNADGGVTEIQFNSFEQIEVLRKYSSYIKFSLDGMSTKDIQSRIDKIKDDRFDEITCYEYNSIGLMVAKHTGSNGLITSTYNAFGEIEMNSQRIDAINSRLTEFSYDRRGLLIQTVDDVDGINKKSSIYYDAFGRVIELEDARSNSTSFILNKRGEQIFISNASNKLKRIFYDAFGRKLKETDFNGNVTKIFSYDDQNNSITLTSPSTNNLIVTQFNAYGDKVSVIDANGFRSDFHYDEKGQLIRIDTPEHGFKEYHYDEAGHLILQQNSGNQFIQYKYDAEGHVLSKIVDPEGLHLITDYQYDALGRQLQIIEPNGLVKQFIYDSQGNLIESCIDPAGLNLITTFSYDDRGFLTRQNEINQHGANKVTAYQWDHLGRRVATIIDPDGLEITTTYQYDQNDNVVSITDPNQHSTHYVFDKKNQCIYQINAGGVVTQYSYDINGNQVQTVTYSRAISGLSEYNEASLKSAIQEDKVKDHYQFNEFDSDSRLLRAYDSHGYLTRYKYDGNGNLISKFKYSQPVPLDELKRGHRPSLENVAYRAQYFVYDGLNQLRFTCDNYGTVSESQYDLNGQLIRSTQYIQNINLSKVEKLTIDYIQENLKTDVQHDQTKRYTYDNAGRLTLELSAESIAKSYQYDNLGNLISSTVYASPINLPAMSDIAGLKIPDSNHDRINHYIYDTAGRECYRISAEGRVLERVYDDVGNIIEEINHSTLVHLSNYSAADVKNALQNEESHFKKSRFEYDASGRLLSETNPINAVTQYSYDAQGNVLSKSDANQSRWIYHYDELNRLIETISPVVLVSSSRTEQKRSVITRNYYDSFGNLITVIRDAEGIKQTLSYEYDNENRKTKAIYPNAQVNNSSSSASSQRQEIGRTLFEEIKYNAYGEVVATSDKSGNWKHYAYNDQGLLKYSIDTLGGITEYSYDSFGRVVNKALYATAIELNNDCDFSINTIEKALKNSDYDRHEFYIYDRDYRLIELSRDAIRTYNPKTGHYDLLKPTTRTVYNSFGEVIKTSVKLNETEWADTYTYYDNDGNKTSIVDAEGYLTAYLYNVFGTVEQITEFALSLDNWDTDKYSNPRTSSKDRIVVFDYDSLGQVTKKTLKQVSYERIKNNGISYESAVGDLTTTYSYDLLGHLISTTDPKGNRSYCYYNELGQLIAKVAPETREGRAATTYSYDAMGQLVETRRWAQGVSEADQNHFKLNGASNQDIITHQEYNDLGQLIADTDGLNHTVYYSYDANSNLARSWRVLKQADNSSIVQDKRYSYDKENHLLQTSTIKNDGTTKNEEAQYNIFGELIAKGINGQFNTHVDYDLSGRVWRSNTQGYYQIYVYDLSEHVTQVVTSTNTFRGNIGEKGLDLSEVIFEKAINYDKDFGYYDLTRQNNTYNFLGHIIAQSKEYTVNSREKSNELRLDIMNQSQTIDRWGNMLSFTNTRGLHTSYEYNVFNQVIKQVLPEVNVVDEYGVGRILSPVNLYAYNELGQAIAMIDAYGHVVSKEYDAMGQVIRETDAKGNQRSKHYNLLDQLTTAVNELGGVTTYTYDQTNRLISLSTPRTHQEYEYDEAGQLIKQLNGAKEETAFWYDASGNQIKRRDARGNYTHVEYDDAGHKIRETDASGRSQSWSYNNEGRLQLHTDLGGHTTSYEYNTNGLLLDESSTAGKHIKYHYQGDGGLSQYSDLAQHETVNYTYDTEGQLISKESGRNDSSKDTWLRETDHYQYDALGRLVQVRRRNPEDVDNRVPDKDHALLSIDYEYDALGNIRHTKVSANYTGYDRIENDDYYTYDENNRMLVNKGQLVNGQIVSTSSQGSSLSYDAAGNITDAVKYENGYIQNYHYQYNLDNQLELIQKNNLSIQSKYYDDAGRVVQENSFDSMGNLSQKNITTYDKGLLAALSTLNSEDSEISKTNYTYDEAGNMTRLLMRVNGQGSALGYTLDHRYSYDLWEGYQQSVDEAYLTVDNQPTNKGVSTRSFSVNGQLKEAVDANTDSTIPTNTTHYLNSSVDGIKARKDKDGQTSYLSVAGKTIGDIRLDVSGKQHLTVYGGFTPSGSQQKAEPPANQMFGWQDSGTYGSTSQFLERGAGDVADGTLPEAPQDNLGAYTLQAGDTLESIALHIYGDSSLWYLLADANGISDRNAQASNNGPLHIGQRITIPPVATGQHQTSGTRKIMNANQMIGNINATTSYVPPTPVPPPLPKKHNGFFSKLVVGIIAVVATVLTAGVIGALAGATSGLTSLFSIGASVLAGGMGSLGGTLAAGFSAGFIGSIASQGVSKALGMQERIDLKGALISGLATAATAGLFRGVQNSATYQSMTQSMSKLPLNNAFSLSSAAEMMEQNATSQSINLALRKHQHFDWEQLGVAGITGGLMGGTIGKKIDTNLKKLDHNTGILSSELRALTTAGAEQATTGAHFNAIEVLKDNFGSAVGSALVSSSEDKNKAKPIESEPDLAQSERTEEAAYRNYQAKLLDGSSGYESMSSTGDNDSLFALNNYNEVYGSKLLGFIENRANLEHSVYGIGKGIFANQNKEVVTAEQLRAMFPKAKQETLDAYLTEFNSQLADGGINTPKRLAYFFATVNEETGGMTKFIENDFTYKDPARAKNKFSTKLKGMSLKEIQALGNGKLFADVIYSDRFGNGDPSSGDGYLYRGRGLFHHTFKDNYKQLGGTDYVKNPDLIIIPKNAVKAAVKFWGFRNLSTKVDLLSLKIPILDKIDVKGKPLQIVKDQSFIDAVTSINNGVSNIAQRAASYNRYIRILQP